MGFPLSTDIFGQLKWLVNQIKLLLFRVKRLENGGVGAQTLQQVTNTGNTTTNPIVIESGTFTTSYEYNRIYSYNSADGENLIINFPAVDDRIINFPEQDGTLALTSDIITPTLQSVTDNGNNTTTNNINLTLSSSGSTYDGTITPQYSTYIETFADNTSITGYYGRSQIAIYESETSARIGIGRTEGYLGGLGFTITNAANNGFVSCDTTQYVINSGNLTNNIKVDSIEVANNPTGQSAKLNFSPTSDSIYTSINGVDVGINLNGSTGKYTIGGELTGNPYFGIETGNARLLSGGILQAGTHNSPAGFIEIVIDGSSYWIELWT